MITLKLKLDYIEAKALRYRAKIDDSFPLYRNFDVTYQIFFDTSMRLTGYSVTVYSVTLRFYCSAN